MTDPHDDSVHAVGVAEAMRVLQARLLVVESERKALGEALDMLRAIPPSLDLVRISIDFGPSGAEMPRPRSTPESRKTHGIIKPAVIAVLKAHAPNSVHASDVVAELRAKGIPLSAKDPKATAVTAMIRLARERRARGWPSGVEQLPGNLFRWVETSGTPSDAGQPSSLFPNVPRESA
jgi:hypothetical protein